MGRGLALATDDSGVGGIGAGMPTGKVRPLEVALPALPPPPALPLPRALC